MSNFLTTVTQQHDNLDAVCHRVLGRTDVIEQVIAANPKALFSPVLPAGLTILIPNLPTAKPQKAQIKLWD